MASTPVERRAITRRFGVSAHDKEKETRTMSARRVVDWRIEPDGDDYILLYRNKTVLHGRNMADIKRYLKKHRTDSQTVFQVAEDGYTTNLTPQMSRRQRSSRSPLAPKPRVPMRMPLMRF